MNFPDLLSEPGAALRREHLLASTRQGKIPSEIAANRVRAARAEFHTPPWWLWWNILSLDAPIVAIVWALLFARAAGRVRLVSAEAVILSLVVWVIYIGDRLLDGWTAKNRAALQERHFFCARHRLPLAFLMALAGAGIVWLALEHLAPLEAKAGLKLGAIVGAYMVGIHAGRESVVRFVPKEVAVGILFAAGTTLPVWAHGIGLSWNMWATVVLFAFLCSLNCLSIECWENQGSNVACRKASPPLVRWVNSRINWIATSLAATALAVLLICHANKSSRPGLLAVSVAAFLIALLNHRRHQLSCHSLRVLADAALVLAGLLALTIRM